VIARWKPRKQRRSDTSGLRPALARLWQRFWHSRALHKLRQIGVVSLVVELRATLNEPFTSNPKVFAKNKDHLNYKTNPTERRRFQDQTRLLDAVRNGGMFRAGLEIGCGAGVYTEVLTQRCESMLVLDISPFALDLARKRRQWSNRVQFGTFDLRKDEIQGTFDLIILAGVLEYFNRPSTLFRVREKLVNALKPGGYLLVETTRRPVLENTWWGRRLIRGQWINWFMSQHPSLSSLASRDTEAYAISLYRRADSKFIR
jgi:SAM-dependent methyltransferase